VKISPILLFALVLIYSPDGTNVYSTRGGKFEGIWSMHWVESCKMMFLGGTSCSLLHILLLQDVSFSHNAQRHRHTDGGTDDSTLLIADHSACAVRSANNSNKENTDYGHSLPTASINAGTSRSRACRGNGESKSTQQSSLPDGRSCAGRIHNTVSATILLMRCCCCLCTLQSTCH